VTVRSKRRTRTQAPRLVRRRPVPDATTEPAQGPPPEAVFDRSTGPYIRRAPPGATRPEPT
jgi:hypothetical protein